MPAIQNFRERKLLKEIYELRDQTGLVTYAYHFSAFKGKWVYIGQTIGYPIPYSTQYTNPQKTVAAGWRSDEPGRTTWLSIPQADPNCLYSPPSSDATWCLMKNPEGDGVKPVYLEEKVECFPFKLPASQVWQEAK
jgi:hypothetical protein